jgi:hypothetical protein
MTDLYMEMMSPVYITYSGHTATKYSRLNIAHYVHNNGIRSDPLRPYTNAVTIMYAIPAADITIEDLYEEMDVCNREYPDDIEARMNLKTDIIKLIIYQYDRMNCCMCCMDSAHISYTPSIFYDYRNYMRKLENINLIDILEIVMNDEIDSFAIDDSAYFLSSMLDALLSTKNARCAEQIILRFLTSQIMCTSPLYGCNIYFFGIVVVFATMFKTYTSEIHSLVKIIDEMDGINLNQTIYFMDEVPRFNVNNYTLGRLIDEFGQLSTCRLIKKRECVNTLSPDPLSYIQWGTGIYNANAYLRMYYKY